MFLLKPIILFSLYALIALNPFGNISHAITIGVDGNWQPLLDGRPAPATPKPEDPSGSAVTFCNGIPCLQFFRGTNRTRFDYFREYDWGTTHKGFSGSILIRTKSGLCMHPGTGSEAKNDNFAGFSLRVKFPEFDSDGHNPERVLFPIGARELTLQEDLGWMRIKFRHFEGRDFSKMKIFLTTKGCSYGQAFFRELELEPWDEVTPDDPRKIYARFNNRFPVGQHSIPIPGLQIPEDYCKDDEKLCMEGFYDRCDDNSPSCINGYKYAGFNYTSSGNGLDGDASQFINYLEAADDRRLKVSIWLHQNSVYPGVKFSSGLIGKNSGQQALITEEYRNRIEDNVFKKYKPDLPRNNSLVAVKILDEPILDTSWKSFDATRNLGNKVRKYRVEAENGAKIRPLIWSHVKGAFNPNYNSCCDYLDIDIYKSPRAVTGSTRLAKQQLNGKSVFTTVGSFRDGAGTEGPDELPASVFGAIIAGARGVGFWGNQQNRAPEYREVKKQIAKGISKISAALVKGTLIDTSFPESIQPTNGQNGEEFPRLNSLQYALYEYKNEIAKKDFYYYILVNLDKEPIQDFILDIPSTISDVWAPRNGRRFSPYSNKCPMQNDAGNCVLPSEQIESDSNKCTKSQPITYQKAQVKKGGSELHFSLDCFEVKIVKLMIPHEG